MHAHIPPCAGGLINLERTYSHNRGSHRMPIPTAMLSCFHAFGPKEWTPLTRPAQEAHDRVHHHRRRWSVAVVIAATLLIAIVTVRPSSSTKQRNRSMPAVVAVGLMQVSDGRDGQHLVTSDAHFDLGEHGQPSEYRALMEDAPPASVAACLQGFPAGYRSACIAQHDRRKQPALEALLAGCTWSAASAKQVIARQGPAKLEMHYVDPSLIAYERCTTAASSALDDPRDGVWEIFRVGPFSTTGGKDWTTWFTKNIAGPCFQNSSAAVAKQDRISKADLLNDTDQYCNDLALDHVEGFGDGWRWPAGPRLFAVRESYLGTMLPTGRLNGYPPIHSHHFHIEEDEGIPSRASLGAMIAHGDDQCLDADNGVGCVIRRAPPGHATVMKLPLHAYTDLNDVRVAGSAPLQWYMVVAMRGRPHDGSFRSMMQVRAWERSSAGASERTSALETT